jgi:hypothetical protein
LYTPFVQGASWSDDDSFATREVFAPILNQQASWCLVKLYCFTFISTPPRPRETSTPCDAAAMYNLDAVLIFNSTRVISGVAYQRRRQSR